ncbi:MAG TPA: BrnT family toxin [Planctomycetota bacterium]|nr:BrnT family toxin [Planctomycetota bacterium]
MADDLTFEWDPWKERANRSKHAVSFEEARTVFLDPNAVEFYDEEHSATEERFLILGHSRRLRLLMVSCAYRERSSLIRIISARKATMRESTHYPGGAQ